MTGKVINKLKGLGLLRSVYNMRAFNCNADLNFARCDESKHALFWLTQSNETRGFSQESDARELN